MVTREEIIKWLATVAAVTEENQELLTQLDAAIGDAEHGISMARGFKKVAEQLREAGDKDISSILKTCGMTLVSTMGGAGGLLFGTLFMDGSRELAGKQELGTADVAAFFRAGLAGVSKRGGAQPGDKTMIDALSPAVASLERSVSAGLSPAEAIGEAAAAARQGMTGTTDMVARKGRASYLGERSRGHQDAGATSLYFIIKALADTVSGD